MKNIKIVTKTIQNVGFHDFREKTNLLQLFHTHCEMFCLYSFEIFFAIPIVNLWIFMV